MARPGLVNQQDLMQWARSTAARSEFPRLLRRLVLETGRGVVGVSFPAAEGVSVGGFDGVIRATAASPFVPAGLSVWELSAEESVGTKANEDYEKRTTTPDGSATESCTYVAVSLRRWRDRSKWARDRTAEGRWKEVRAYAVDDIEAWLEQTAVTHAWLSEYLGFGPYGLHACESWWESWSLGTIPPLTEDVVLAGRTAEAEQLGNKLAGPPCLTTVRSKSIDDAHAFIAAVAKRTSIEDPTVLPRTVFVADAATWRSVANRAGPLILVPAERIDAPELLAAKGHHVVVPVIGELEADIKLPALDAAAVSQALQGLGIDDSRQSDYLGRLARRSVVALRRRLAVRPELQMPNWGQSPADRIVRGVLLAGRWNERKDGDRAVLNALCGIGYEELSERLASFASQQDPYVTAVDRTWALVSPDDAWVVLRGQLRENDLSNLEVAIKDVLWEIDPALSLPQEERWLAPVKGNVRAFSQDLRNGLSTTLAFLGLSADYIAAGDVSGSTWASRQVRTLLNAANEDATCELWFSIAELLPDLAEAAPDAFIDGVREGLKGDSPRLGALFLREKTSDFTAPRSPHTYLLRALENLASSSDHFGHVIDLLARLAVIDPNDEDDHFLDRPFNSLVAIFCPWYRETQIDLSGRLETIDRMRDRHPAIAWRLMLKLLPAPHAVHLPTYQPRFRDWKPSDRTVSDAEKLAFWDGLVQRLIEDAETSGTRWAALLEMVADLPPHSRDKVRTCLDALAQASSLTETDHIWEAMRDFTSEHREFSDALWALPSDEVDRFEDTASRLEPGDPVKRSAWLFSSGLLDLDDRQRQRESGADQPTPNERRNTAILSVLNTGGVEDVQRLVAATTNPWIVGVSVADVAGDTYQSNLLEMLDSEDDREREVSFAYFARLFESKGWEWICGLHAERPDLSTNVTARLLIATNDYPRAWDVAESWGETVRSRFWELIWPDRAGLAVDAIHAGRCLLGVGRQAAALKLVYLRARRTRTEDREPRSFIFESVNAGLAQIAIEALEGLLKRDEPDTELMGLSQYELNRIFQLLRVFVDSLGADRLAVLEWHYLRFLGIDAKAEILHEKMATDPGFFVDVISAAYPPKTEDSPSVKAPPGHQERAQTGYQLLQSWSIVPALADGSAIDEQGLSRWLDDARKQLEKADRLDLGEMHFGQVLAYARADQDGLWPPEAVRELLERLESDTVEGGLCIEVRRRRGVTIRSPEEGGIQEQALVQDYRAQAALFRDRWPRTASMLIKLASSYEHEARRHDQSAERLRIGLD